MALRAALRTLRPLRPGVPGALSRFTPRFASSSPSSITATELPRPYGPGERAPDPPRLTPARAHAIASFNLRQLQDDEMMYTAQLDAIRELSDRPLTDRWQSLIHVYMTSQVHALLHFGYTPDDQGLRSFVVEYDALSKDKLSDEGKNLFELTRKRWNAMVKRAFNVDLDVQELPVEQARQLSSILSMKMQSDDFMAQIDSSMEKLGKDADAQAKQRTLVEILLPLQQQVAEDNGFKGEEGYIRMQTLLMHHSTDDAVSYNTMSGTMAVFRRANINIS